MSTRTCDCCGRKLTKVVYTDAHNEAVICSRCHAWKPYGELTPNVRRAREELR